jgi:hypothetical protein
MRPSHWHCDQGGGVESQKQRLGGLERNQQPIKTVDSLDLLESSAGGEFEVEGQGGAAQRRHIVEESEALNPAKEVALSGALEQ